jgi:hypothetical protein
MFWFHVGHHICTCSTTNKRNATIRTHLLHIQVNNWMSLGEVKRVTGMDKMSMEDCIEVFAGETVDDALSRDAFARAFVTIAEPKGLSKGDRERLKNVMTRLFDAFDKNKDGMVDLNELSSGLAVLCDGEPEEKVEGEFGLCELSVLGLVFCAVVVAGRYICGCLVSNDFLRYVFDFCRCGLGDLYF